MSSLRVEPDALGTAIQAYRLAPNGAIPNSALPLLVVPQALPFEAREPGQAKRLLEKAGWTGTWTYTVFPFWHFHSRGHEVLACIAGEALIGFGGDGRLELRMKAGDAVLIPAGVAHRRIEGTDAFQVAGAYPPGQEGDIVRPGSMEEDAVSRSLAALGLPETDPLTGERPGMLSRWTRSGAPPK